MGCQCEDPEGRSKRPIVEPSVIPWAKIKAVCLSGDDHGHALTGYYRSDYADSNTCDQY